MAPSANTKRRRNTFLIVFIVSSVLSLAIIYIYSLSAFHSSAPSGTPTSPSEQIGVIGGLVAALASCLTAVVSFFGFIATAVFGWRKETREAKAAELERKRLEIELEKQRLEVSKLKAGEKQ